MQFKGLNAKTLSLNDSFQSYVTDPFEPAAIMKKVELYLLYKVDIYVMLFLLFY